MAWWFGFKILNHPSNFLAPNQPAHHHWATSCAAPLLNVGLLFVHCSSMLQGVREWLETVEGDSTCFGGLWASANTPLTRPHSTKETQKPASQTQAEEYTGISWNGGSLTCSSVSSILAYSRQAKDIKMEVKAKRWSRKMAADGHVANTATKIAPAPPQKSKPFRSPQGL